MLSSKTNALLTLTLASFWRKQSCHVYNDNEPTRVQTCEPFPGETSIALKALCWKSGGRKKVLVMLGYHSIQQMLSV